MGISYLQIGLERAYKDWRGDKQEIDRHIEETMAAYEALSEKKARSERLAELIASAETILTELSPGWSGAAIRPTYKGTKKLPFEIASVGRWTMDFLRQATSPTTTRRISEHIMTTQGMSVDDREVFTRLTNTIDSALRQRLKKGQVVKEGAYPVFWSVKPLDADPTD